MNRVSESGDRSTLEGYAWQALEEFVIQGAWTQENQVAEQVARAVQELDIAPVHLERIQAAVTQTLLNSIEHVGHRQSSTRVCIRLMDPAGTATVQPDLTVSEEQDEDSERNRLMSVDGENSLSRRSWGFFLVRRADDNPEAEGNETNYTIELFIYPEGNRSERDEDQGS
jgi:hypothetical protein